MVKQRYAYEQTKVPVGQSMMAIEKELMKLGSRGRQWTAVGDVIELKWALPIKLPDGRQATIPIRHRISTKGKREVAPALPPAEVGSDV